MRYRGRLSFWEKVIDRLSPGRILSIGLLSIVFLTAFIHLALSIASEDQAQAALAAKQGLEQEIQHLESEQAERSKLLLPGTSLPSTLNELQAHFESKGLRVEEASIHQPSAPADLAAAQVVIRLTVTGEPSRIVETVRENLQAEHYALSFQEIDISGSRAVIQLTILLES